jgi:hypothetical protein
VFTTVVGAPAQQLQVQGGQVVLAGHAAQAHAQPPLADPEPPLAPASGGGLMCMHEPEGHGVVKQAIPSWIQKHESAESAAHEVESVCVVQGSAGGVVVAQSQGAQAAPAGQAGQAHTGGDVVDPDEPPAAPAAVPPVGPLPTGIVVVIVGMGQVQLQAGQAVPAGHSGQLQVQVPLPLEPEPEPQALEPPAPAEPPAPPVPTEPPVPPVPPPQSHLQGGQASPGRQAGQLQLQVAPPLPTADDDPPLTVGRGGQSQLTLGQVPVLGQATGWTHPHPFPVTPRARQKPDGVQSCPAGQRAGIVSVACVAVQAHRLSPEQALESV